MRCIRATERGAIGIRRCWVAYPPLEAKSAGGLRQFQAPAVELARDFALQHLRKVQDEQGDGDW